MSVVSIEKSGGVMHVRLNRADVQNACDGATYAALAQARDELERDTDLRIGIFSGEGENFCVGTDVDWLGSGDAEGFIDPLYPRMMHGRKPVIAAIHGRCIGAGFEIALACDIRICSESAQFGSGDSHLVWIPGGYITQRLPRLIPLGPAMEILHTGSLISAGDAHRLGLVNHVLSDEVRLMNKAEDIAERIVKMPPSFTETIKTSVMDGLDMALPSAVKLGIDYYNQLTKS